MRVLTYGVYVCVCVCVYGQPVGPRGCWNLPATLSMSYVSQCHWSNHTAPMSFGSLDKDIMVMTEAPTGW